MNLDTIFLEVSKGIQRKFYYDVLTELKDKYEKIVIPCTGQFILAKVAIEAGIEPSRIQTSDIGLLSSIIGYIVTDRPLAQLDISIQNPSDDEAYRATENDVQKAAFLMWRIKTLQLKESVYFERIHIESLVKDKDRHLNSLAAKIETLVSQIKGINYEIKDIRQEISEAKNSIIIVHPPTYSTGGAKMKAVSDYILWNQTALDFSFKNEFSGIYNECKEKTDSIAFWSLDNTTFDLPQRDIVFAEEKAKSKYEYFACTKPDQITTKLKYEFQAKKDKQMRPLPIPIVSSNFEFKTDTKIDVHKITFEQAMYYRDLWAHKMGTTKAEQYYLFTLDGCAFGVTGFHVSEAYRLVSKDVFEVFGFDQPINKHPEAHKLFMMLLTCNDMRRILINAATKNRIFDINGFKTVCLTKYRKLKSSTGLLSLLSREKLPDGNYKLMYYTRFYKRTFEETLKIWLETVDGKELPGA